MKGQNNILNYNVASFASAVKRTRKYFTTRNGTNRIRPVERRPYGELVVFPCAQKRQLFVFISVLKCWNTVFFSINITFAHILFDVFRCVMCASCIYKSLLIGVWGKLYVNCTDHSIKSHFFVLQNSKQTFRRLRIAPSRIKTDIFFKNYNRGFVTRLESWRLFIVHDVEINTKAIRSFTACNDKVKIENLSPSF